MFNWIKWKNFERCLAKNLKIRNRYFSISISGNPSQQLISKHIQKILKQKKFAVLSSYSIKRNSFSLTLCFNVDYEQMDSPKLFKEKIINNIKNKKKTFSLNLPAENSKKIKSLINEAILELEIIERKITVCSTRYKIEKGKITFYLRYMTNFAEGECKSIEEFKDWIRENLSKRNSYFDTNLINQSKIKNINFIFKNIVEEFGDYFKNSLISSQVSILKRENSKIVSIKTKFLTNKTQELFINSSVLKFIKENIFPNQNDLEKIRIVNDYIVKNVVYDKKKKYFSAYDALYFGKAVCDGYSLLAQNIFEKIGVKSIILKSKQMNHSWNMVKFDGNWFHLDITWNSQKGNNGFFCLSDREIKKKKHLWNGSLYPKARRTL